ncbi:hypothetical protein NQ152_07225 [Microbacterium sp. zg.B48]|uniref:hypothetical protein n=1 Tax=Microbacterium sp. zg.B48 TaxID=2969408 RepID=UPI00214CA901|nr:hypothetical protein [Microbacterium sp. zg.B48]MCR2763303.1 hypothetical protein [Microbacterium sp. zg.B48]
MTQPIDRRSVLAGSVALASIGLASLVTTPAAYAVTTTASPRVGAARPSSITSYGPNGTHYPTDLPWVGEPAAHELVVNCDWTSIANAIKSLTPARVAQGVAIRVRPGILPGNGSGSSAKAVLSGVGSMSWTRNVLICPLEGFGSVTVADKGIRIDQCARLSFFGLQSQGQICMTLCGDMQMGWSRWSGMNLTRGGANIALYEVVLGFRRNPEDTSGVRPTETYPMTNISRYGCVFGPSVKPAGSSAHCDTIQLEGTGTGTFGSFTSVDCVDYGSSNAVVMMHQRLSLAEFRHCLILGDVLPWQVYPLQAGDYAGRPNAFSGWCADVRLYDSVVAGAVGSTDFTRIERTTLSYAPQASQQPTVSGTWTVDTGIAGWNAAAIMAQQHVPDYEDATLAGIWSW